METDSKLAYTQALACDKIRDAACVKMLLITSSPVGRMLYRAEIRMGVPAYDEPPRLPGEPRMQLTVAQQCAADGCTNRFVVQRTNAHQLYCSKRCSWRESNKLRNLRKRLESA